jgi:hypothetical protein
MMYDEHTQRPECSRPLPRDLANTFEQGRLHRCLADSFATDELLFFEAVGFELVAYCFGGHFALQSGIFFFYLHGKFSGENIFKFLISICSAYTFFSFL